MKKSAMNSDGRSAGIVVVHEHATGVSMLHMTRSGGKAEVKATRQASKSELAAAARAFCEQCGTTEILRLAPLERTLARASILNEAAQDDAALAASLSLLAEAELPSDLPDHRRSAGVVAMAAEGNAKVVLFTGWRGPSTPPLIQGSTERWTTVPAALFMLKSGTGTLAAYTDGTTGAMTVIASGPEKTVVRVVLEEVSADAEEWNQSVAKVLASTADAAGTDAGSVSFSGRSLRLEQATFDDLRSRVIGVRDDAAWRDEFGILVGAGLLGLAERASVHTLTEMSSSEPPINRSFATAATESLRDSSRSWIVIAACIVLMLFASFAIAWGRSEVLGARADKLSGVKGGKEEIERRGALYAQLEQARWPMTKLISDIGTAAPVGVSIKNLRLSPGQGITLKGAAKSGELVNAFQANLNATKLFAEVTVGRMESGTEGVEFDLSAKVTSPHTTVKAQGEQDFAAKPLAERLYGHGSKNTDVAAPPEPRTRRADRTGNGGSSGDTSRRPAASSSEPPSPLTDEQIAKMDRSTAMREWSQRRSFVQKNPSLDKATKDRLEAEVPKLRDQMAKAGGAK